MDYIQTSNKQVDKFGAGQHGFNSGNPSMGILATALSVEWCDDVQQEIVNAILQAGLVPTAGVRTQLLQALAILTRSLYGRYAPAAGTANAITADFTPDVTALSNGLVVRVRAGAANTTATPSFQADATAAKTIVKNNGIALVAGDIAGSGHELDLQYDAGLDKWMLLNPATATVAAACSGNSASATTAAACTGNAATATVAASCTGNSASATTAAACTGNSASATTAAACTGNAATATVAASCTGNSASATTAAACTGNSATATSAGSASTSTTQASSDNSVNIATTAFVKNQGYVAGSNAQLTKAWLNFNGSAAGTITPRANFNVSSVTKVTGGRWTLNYTSALPSADYTVSGGVNLGQTVLNVRTESFYGQYHSTTSVTVDAQDSTNATLWDASMVSVVINGN